MYVCMCILIVCGAMHVCKQMYISAQRDVECINLRHSVLSEHKNESWKTEYISKMGLL